MEKTIYQKKLPSLRAMMALFGGTQAIFAQRVLVMQENGLTPTQIGIILSISSIIQMFTPIITGIIADKLRSRYKVFIITSIGSMIVYFLIPNTARFLFLGISLSAITVPAMQLFMPAGSNMLESCAITSTFLVPDLDFSSLRIFMSLGYAITNVAFTPIMNATGSIAVPYYIIIVYEIFLIILAPTLLIYQDPETEEAVENKKEALKKGEKSGNKLQFGEIFKSYYLISFTLLAILFTVPQTSSSFTSYLLSDIGADGSSIGTVAGIRVFGEVAVLLMLKRLRTKIGVPGLLVGAEICQLVEVLLYPVCTSVAMVSAVNFIGGFGWGIALGTATLYLRSLAPKGLETTVNAFWTISFSAGSILTSLFGGRIVDTYGVITLYRISAIVAVIWILLFSGSFIFGKKVLGKEAPVSFFRARRA